MPGVAAIILAAGGSSRMGRPKQLLPIAGVPMLSRAVRLARDAGCHPIVVVLGRDADACRTIAAGDDVTAIANDDWERGMGSSLRAGARAVPDDAAAAYILLADQPRVSVATLHRLDAAAAAPGVAVAVAAYADTIGPPVRVGRQDLARLREWNDDRGAKALWTGRSDVVRVPCPEAAFDIDTPADYERMRHDLSNRT